MQLPPEILHELRIARAKDTRTQEQLAQACGCTQGQISRILSGKTKNMRGHAYRLCEALNIRPKETAYFDWESHLARIESVADPRQRELVGVIRHAFSRLNISASEGAEKMPDDT